MKASPRSCLRAAGLAHPRVTGRFHCAVVIDVSVIICHLVENFVHALKKEIPSAFLRATGKHLPLKRRFPRNFIAAERAASDLACISPFANSSARG